MLSKTQDNEEIIERVAALDIGKAELTCCVRVPDEDHRGTRVGPRFVSERFRKLLTLGFAAGDG